MATMTGIETGRPNILSELQMAEYNQLTSRITDYVAMQNAAWGIAAALFGYLASLWWKVDNPLNLEWIGMLCLLSVSWAVLHINYEFSLIALYILEELLPRMTSSSTVLLDKSLGFERWIRTFKWFDNCHRNEMTFAPFIVGFVALSSLIGKGIYCAQWSAADLWWLVISGSLALIVVVKSVFFVRLGKRIKRASQGSISEERTT